MNKVSLPKEKEELLKLDKDFDKVVIHLKRKYEGYELKNKVIASLRNKGYKMKDILNIWEKKYGEIDYCPQKAAVQRLFSFAKTRIISHICNNNP